MPKQVDHQQRRTLLADALWEIVAEHGLEAVSLREVAERAGVSIGQVQHYFRNKESMLRFTMERFTERIGGRMGQAIAAGAPTVLDTLRAVVRELLPVTPEQRTEFRVWLAFRAYANVDDTIAEILREQHTSSREHIVLALRHAEAAGELAAGLDPDRAAETLLALVDGLSTSADLLDHPAEHTLALLDDHFRALAGRA